MKIAITAASNDLSSLVDSRFGRAKWFILIDTTDGAWQAFSNEQNLQAAQGAGIQSAQRVVKLGAEAVVTGHVGPKAFKTLKAANILVFLCQTGAVQEAVDQMRQGLLREAADADVEGHWA